MIPKDLEQDEKTTFANKHREETGTSILGLDENL
jgi:hypothetical protein